jgi:hypothetical protein
MVPTEAREDAVLRKLDLLKRGGPSVARQGGVGEDFRSKAPDADPRFDAR